eukprot:TRINITY_DN50351_c0_g1_i1.p1 TRINITY_DN50351_c0_g1~~TRINITY_DN50351_c0_g1_i1.p1  ORF type:complete len:326 (-),score=89.06 TRINITY_DN50351_c0_g1_i1:263-1240(-)
MAAAAPTKPQKMARVAIPDDFEVDKEKRYSGTVAAYSKWRGFGHIDMDQKGVIPGDKLFVHWKNIQTDDRFPRLKQELKVEFGVMISNDWQGWKKVRSVKAKTVTLPGGAMINLQDEMDAEKKQFVGAQNLRYTGTLKFYDPFRGFGWVVMDEGFDLSEPVPQELKVESAEVNCGGRIPRLRIDKTSVEFGIVKNKKGDFLAYNMTLPGGVPITQENLEHRQDATNARFSGTISWFNRRQGWGHIAPDSIGSLPQNVQVQLDAMAAAAAAKPLKEGQEPRTTEKLLYFRKADSEWGFKPEIGTKVTFLTYTDDKGAGARGVDKVE